MKNVNYNSRVNTPDATNKSPKAGFPQPSEPAQFPRTSGSPSFGYHSLDRILQRKLLCTTEVAARTNKVKMGIYKYLKTLFLEICGVTGRGALTSLPLQVHPLKL